jgi:hypothetical protein
MKYLLITSLLIFSFNLSIPLTAFGQDDGPPAIAMPNKQNSELINELVEITDFKNVFKTFCILVIKKTSKENNWSSEKIKKITENINYKSFDWHVQNALAKYSNKELKDLIELYKKDRKKSMSQNIIVNDDLIERNLQDYGLELIKGSYVKSNK